jgi:predicted DNA-binding protein (MmcQ/YjbR family)
MPEVNIELIRNICNSLPSVSEDIKWGNDLCFIIAGKIFCAVSLEIPLKVSIKVTDEEFDELTGRPGIIPAPYVARHKWLLIENINLFQPGQWEYYIKQSYDLVKAKLPKKKVGELNS